MHRPQTRQDMDMILNSADNLGHAVHAFNDPAKVALLQKSAKPTNDNSPPIHRWVWDLEKDVVRATDGWGQMLQIHRFVQSSASRTLNCLTSSPSAKALGYW